MTVWKWIAQRIAPHLPVRHLSDAQIERQNKFIGEMITRNFAEPVIQTSIQGAHDEIGRLRFRLDALEREHDVSKRIDLLMTTLQQQLERHSR